MRVEEIKNKLLPYLEGEPEGRATIYRLCAITDLAYSTLNQYLNILFAEGVVGKVCKGRTTLWVALKQDSTHHTTQ